MIQYLEALKCILEQGDKRTNRTGVSTISLFGDIDFKFDLRSSFPLITTKKMFTNSVLAELLWFISGSNNINDLKKIDPSCKIWDANYQDYIKKNSYQDNGDCGHIYGKAWRNFGNSYQSTSDQLATLLKNLREDPDSRRLIVNAWHPDYVDKKHVALPPCHVAFHCNVVNGYLDLLMYQRSCDMFLGVPFNIASYAMLMHILAKLSGLTPRYFIHKLGDAHIYENHIDQVNLQLTRSPFEGPTLKIADRGQKDFKDFKMEDFVFTGYEHHPFIKGEMAV